MSSSVDDAVLDYFSLLLEEENNEVGNDASLFDVPRFKNLQERSKSGLKNHSVL